MSKLKCGDRVILKSGGPTMTFGRPSVEHYSLPTNVSFTADFVVSSELYRCHWFAEDGTLHSADFFEEELMQMS
jgi:uncharacterized protein YodC (DUF2158 family)